MKARTLKRTTTDKTTAHMAVARAVQEGVLPRYPPACEVCGVLGEFKGRNTRWTINRHHWSYLPEHHLDVVAVCHPCHSAIHFAKIPEPKTGLFRTDTRSSRGKRLWTDGDDRQAVWAVASAYPKHAPFMRRERQRQVEQYIDAKVPAWREMLDARDLPGPLNAWSMVWDGLREIRERGFSLPPVAPVLPADCSGTPAPTLLGLDDVAEPLPAAESSDALRERRRIVAQLRAAGLHYAASLVERDRRDLEETP